MVFSRFVGQKLALLLCVAATGVAVFAAELPVTNVGEWRVLAMDGGMIFARNTAADGGARFVFGGDGYNHRAPLSLLQAAGSDDLAAAVEALAKQVGLSARDVATAKSFATEFFPATTGNGGKWQSLTYADAFALASKSDMGIFRDNTYVSLTRHWNSVATATASIGTGYCKAAGMVDVTAAVATVSSTAKSASGAQVQAFSAVAAGACAGIFPTWPPTSPPAWPPAAPGWTPPTGPPGNVKWVGSTCTNFGQTVDCMNSDGQMCTCTCEGAGATGILQSRGCRNVPSNPPGTACTPAGGIGPCDGSCACNCAVTPGSPPGTGPTWQSPPQCGSSLPLWLALVSLLGLRIWRRA